MTIMCGWPKEGTSHYSLFSHYDYISAFVRRSKDLQLLTLDSFSFPNAASVTLLLLQPTDCTLVNRSKALPSVSSSREHNCREWKAKKQ